jgi:hypothetical protein
MKFRAWVTTDTGEQLHLTPRWIALDEEGHPERVCGPSGLQYSEFVLEVEK